MLSNLTVIIFHASQKNVITTDVEERLFITSESRWAQPRYHSRCVYLCERPLKVKNFKAVVKESLI